MRIGFQHQLTSCSFWCTRQAPRLGAWSPVGMEGSSLASSQCQRSSRQNSSHSAQMAAQHRREKGGEYRVLEYMVYFVLYVGEARGRGCSRPPSGGEPQRERMERTDGKDGSHSQRMLQVPKRRACSARRPKRESAGAAFPVNGACFSGPALVSASPSPPSPARSAPGQRTHQGQTVGTTAETLVHTSVPVFALLSTSTQHFTAVP